MHWRNYVAQVDEMDCGVAALAMILKNYGSTTSLAYLRNIAKTSLEGTTALGLVKTAEKLGFEVDCKINPNAVRTKKISFL